MDEVLKTIHVQNRTLRLETMVMRSFPTNISTGVMTKEMVTTMAANPIISLFQTQNLKSADLSRSSR